MKKSTARTGKLLDVFMAGLLGPETENDAECYVMRCSIWLLKSVKTWLPDM
jgi:hypothetical protein